MASRTSAAQALGRLAQPTPLNIHRKTADKIEISFIKILLFVFGIALCLKTKDTRHHLETAYAPRRYYILPGQNDQQSADFE
ncbi:MAG: hypothetical protein IKC97_04355 [Clostridia bacterium]|nr:hypothetical protein [Clostridia bacterium]